MKDDAGESVAIVGGTVIDGNGGPPIRDAVIVIESGRITAGRRGVNPDSRECAEAGGEGQIRHAGHDGRERASFFPIIPDGLVRYEGRYEDVILEAAQIALKNGLTTIFDTWGPREALIHVRDRIKGGELVGSRVFLAGNIIGLGGPRRWISFRSRARY